MKQLHLIAITMLTLAFPTFADTTDPIADYKAKQGLEATDIIYKWSADIDGDGKSEVFLSLKEEYQDARKVGQMPPWLVYLAKHDGSGYALSTGEDDNNVVSLGPIAAIDPDKLFVGQITQLGKHGIVTMQRDHPRRGDDIAYIYAYTVEGDHLKRTKLGQYTIEKTDPPLFKQYLADDKRTHVTLQEVTP
jgi:hypothetical protein